jgi:hypothetical protein
MEFMSRVGRAIYSVGEFYANINPSTLTGAVDVIVVQDAEGNLACSPFHVRFGKLQLLRPQDKIVNHPSSLTPLSKNCFSMQKIDVIASIGGCLCE